MKKVTRRKRPQIWVWAHKHDNRVKKHWNWRMISAMRGVEHKSCVPFVFYKWRAFGFDGKHQPVWTIDSFLGEVK